jgi:hypothetical protein
MTVRQFREFEEGQRPSSEEMNRLTGLVDSFTTFTAPASFNDVTGLHLREADRSRILAKITGVLGSAYSWVEMQGDGTGTGVTQVLDGGLSGSTTVNPAYEVAGSTTVATNSIVELFLGNGEFWYFTQPSAGTLTVREVDLGPTVTMVTTLEFDQVDGYVVSTPSAGVARIDHADASATQRGIVSLTAQTLGDGEKRFDDTVVMKAENAINWRVTIGTPATSIGSINIGSFAPGDNEFTLVVIDLAGSSANASFYDTITGMVFEIRQAGKIARYATTSAIGVTLFGVQSQDAMVSVDVRGGIVVSGLTTLPVGSGGTGATSLTANGVILGNGTSAVQVTAAGTTGLVLTGTTGSAPTFQALVEASLTAKGIVNLSDQILGAGNKAVFSLGIGTGASLAIAGVTLEQLGKSYFENDIWIKHTQAIVVYNGGVTTQRIETNSTLGQWKLQVADGGSSMFLSIQAFAGVKGCDLTHNDGSTVPRFSVNGTLGDAGATYANPTSIVTKGGIVTSCVAGSPGKGTVTAFTATATATVASTTEATLIGSGVGSLTFAANSLTAGKTIRIRARGFWSTDAVTAGTMRWRVKLGATTVLDTGAITPTIAISNSLWQLDAEITCRTTGASGTVFGQGYADRQEAAGVAFLTSAMVNTSTTTIDTTASQILDVTFVWGVVNDPDNTISSTNVSVETLN